MPAAPVKAPSSAPSSGGGKHAAPGQGKRDAAQLAQAGAVTYAEKSKKGSVSGGVAKGAVAGASTGAMVGSVVPGVGTAVGAGVGAVVGGGAGGISTAKKNRDAARANRGGAQKLLVAEFVICMIILAFSPLTSDKEVAPKDWMKRGSAMSLLFLILGLVSSGSPALGRVCASFGGLVTIVLLVDQRSLFTVIAKKLQTGGTATGSVLEGSPNGDDEIDSGIGEARPRPDAQPQQRRRVVSI